MSTEISLRESQLATLEILKKIDSICAELNIKYWITYGTLIGAIRHKGFIPWDDDLDIGMSRPDYDKFLAYCYDRKSDLKPFEVHNRTTIDSCPFNITRFCDNRYRCEFYYYKNYLTSGLFVDIYPYDGMGMETDRQYWKKINFKRLYYLKMVSFSAAKKLPASKNFFKSIANFILFFLARNRNADYYLDKLEKITTPFLWENSDYAYCTNWCFGKEIPFFPRIFFENFIYIDFENIKVPIIKEYDAFLRGLYGDYMKPPPEIERKTQHSYTVYKVESGDED